MATTSSSQQAERMADRCPFFQPWCNTSRGEIDNACVCREHLLIKRCDRCVDVPDNPDWFATERDVRQLAITKIQSQI